MSDLKRVRSSCAKIKKLEHLYTPDQITATALNILPVRAGKRQIIFIALTPLERNWHLSLDPVLKSWNSWFSSCTLSRRFKRSNCRYWACHWIIFYRLIWMLQCHSHLMSSAILAESSLRQSPCTWYPDSVSLNEWLGVSQYSAIMYLVQNQCSEAPFDSCKPWMRCFWNVAVLFASGINVILCCHSFSWGSALGMNVEH